MLERRHVIGGAAVTEEIIPGFKFSRASYLAGLLRPKVIQELELAQVQWDTPHGTCLRLLGFVTRTAIGVPRLTFSSTGSSVWL